MVRVALPLLVLATAAHAQALDRESIRATVAPHVDELAACYDKFRATHPDAKGRVMAKIEIASDGHVAAASAKGIHAEVETCIAGKIKTWKFPAHKDPGSVIINYPFDFAPPPAAAKPDPVDPKLVAMFDQGVALAKAKKHAEALALYRKVLETQRKGKLAVIPRFTATVNLHLVYELMDLGKFKEAKAQLALVEVSALGKPTQYDYHFTNGNVLGKLGELKPMFSAFVEAISIAEDLDDLTVRPPLCWTQILSFTMKAKDWAYLKEVSAKALQVAQLRGYKDLELKAKVAAAEAQKNLGK